MQPTLWRHRRLQSEIRALRVRIRASGPKDSIERLSAVVRMIHRMGFVPNRWIHRVAIGMHRFGALVHRLMKVGSLSSAFVASNLSVFQAVCSICTCTFHNRT